YVLADSYISVIEAVKHAAWSLGRVSEIVWLDAERYERGFDALRELASYQGIIVPGGFGARGVEGKIKVIEFCRKNDIPFLGLCYGLQLAIVEFGRNVCKLKGAHTTETNNKTSHPVIHMLPEQLVNIREKRMGGSMRLGAYTCALLPGTRSHSAYCGFHGRMQKKNAHESAYLISERHRHRFEVNNDYRDIFEKNGMVFAGINPERNLVEIAELKKHPFFIGTQFHPEFKSRPLKPHPLFREFIKTAIKRKI
ncbi:MAG: gamma-glutamyl-gamma-aminobutyrate hydrolase family protein, partial [Candidatus Colwellbacteria bacterium]|nr:gamma-glutamyl-gamma-aminobutyrate hydrolase family protein [Candidatus Colwellbacteria bacterium]